MSARPTKYVFVTGGVTHLLPLAVGALNLKDVVAFRRGPTLGIPEAAKPGIYARVRRVIGAPTLTSLPAWTSIRPSTPACSASSSTTAFSDSISAKPSP